MRRTMVTVRRLALLALASAGLLVVATEPAHAVLCSPHCCPWDAVQGVSPAWSIPDATESVVAVPGNPAPQYCSPQHCEPVLRH